jgi:hypothetical protein
MTDDHREAGTAYPRFSVRFVSRHATNPTENRGEAVLVSLGSFVMERTSLKTEDKQFLLLYDHPSCNEPH